MKSRIRLLPDMVANQIAAGEVVNRPASVVKEMMENAVDAGCGSVTVNFRDGGKELIHVVDDGCGMSHIDARMAFDRHATSKIQKVDDIYTLATFGFRGEALASIGAVAEVELLTRQEGEDLGSKTEISGGAFKGQELVSCGVGSQFMVRNLFYNVPARRRFLDKSSTESRHITTEFQRVALCHPSISFSLYNNDALIYSLGSATLSQRIVGVIGKHIANNLLEVETQTSIVKIEGFVGRPSASKQNNKDQFLFVNGRFFKSGYFHKAIVQAYDKLIPSNTQPAYFIYLTIAPERIDVNVHPQKTEVKFDDNTAVWQILNAAVRESLGKLGVVPMMDFEVDSSIEIPVYRDRTIYKEPIVLTNPEFDPFQQEREQSDYEQSLMEYIDGEQSVMEIESGAMFVGEMGIGERYCATTIGGELVVVDVKRAYEAILYDKYMLMLGSEHSVSQQLLFPESVILTLEDVALVREYADDFVAFGFDLEFTNDVTITILGVPADFTNSSAGVLIDQILNSVRDQTMSAGELRRRFLAGVLSRVGSVSIAKSKSNIALNELLKSLGACSNANYTHDGRPVMTIIGESEIQKRLNR